MQSLFLYIPNIRKNAQTEGLRLFWRRSLEIDVIKNDEI